jgi:cytochrome c-type biogenesis protein CcmH/NrfG
MSESTVKMSGQQFVNAPEEAEKHFQSLVAKDPRDLAAHLALGVTRLKLKKPVEALGAFSSALKIDPTNKAALTLLAVATEQAGLHQEAIEAWRVVATAGGDAQLSADRIVEHADRTGQKDLALQARRDLARHGNPLALGDLGVHLSRRGMHTEAVKAFERAMLADPSFLNSHPVEQAAYQKSRAALSKN